MANFKEQKWILAIKKDKSDWNLCRFFIWTEKLNNFLPIGAVSRYFTIISQLQSVNLLPVIKSSATFFKELFQWIAKLGDGGQTVK